MKLIHLSDLHLGKRVNEFSMLEDQADILRKIIGVIGDERPDGVLIAGDVYDKPIPPAEAVSLFDDFLCSLAELGVQVFVISGNHDSPERIAFGARLMDKSGIHLAPVYNGQVKPVVLHDSFGEVLIYLLPFVKPVQVRRFFPTKEIGSYTQAMAAAVEQMQVDTTKRNLLVTHQFVTGASRTESEDLSVGGADNVDASVFADFDYVALGHIHRPQSAAGERVRYCGTPLKYSFSEASDQKSVTVVEMLQKGVVQVRMVPLQPLHDLRKLKGSYAQLTCLSNYQNTPTGDYLHITLTDESDIPEAMNKLRVIYPNLMQLEYDNRRTRKNQVIGGAQAVEQKTPLELFDAFFELQNNRPMEQEQRAFVKQLMESIWEVTT